MKTNGKFTVLIGTVAVLMVLLMPATSSAAFGLSSVSVTARNRDGSVDLQAGSHPYSLTVKASLNLAENTEREAIGSLRSVVVELPQGLVGNPLAVPRCSEAQFDGTVPQCPLNTQVGVLRVQASGFQSEEPEIPIYNLVPPSGLPAVLAGSIAEQNSFQNASVRAGLDYGIDVSDITIPPDLGVYGLTEEIWGVPADEGHDALRGLGALNFGVPATFVGEELPFLTLPGSCGAPLRTTITIESLEEPGSPQSRTFESTDDSGALAGLVNCQALSFAPTMSAQPSTTKADSPVGLNVAINVPQNQTPGGLATANLKDTSIALPSGMAVNPSAANGLEACSEADMGYRGTANGVPQFSSDGANCPAASRVGDVTVETPLLDHSLEGGVYLAAQEKNPFGSLLALYIAVDDAQSGVVLKLPGKVTTDPTTGQLIATFAQNPELPFEHLRVNFFEGPRATLTSPSTCGNFATTASFTPWTAPEGATVQRSDSFQGGAGCASSESHLSNSPSFEAGTIVALGGTYSPFVLKVSRENGSQRIGRIEATLPAGLVGKVAGVPYCSDSQIATAASRSGLGQGAVEQASPSCPLASEVGTVVVGAGSGTPFYVQGHVYLAGPYKGAPLSLEIITPAVAGPFDLGTVAVRTALYVNESTAQIHAVSDPIPSILAGIPLDVRSIALNMDKPEFTLNPTSCNAMAVLGSTTSTLGQSAALQNRFQVGGCRGLQFKPELKLAFTGQTKRLGNPAVKAVLTQPKGQNANVSGATVILPKGMFIDQAHINNPCTRVQFNSGALPGEGCPTKSILGTAKVWTPLLEKPEEGKVYFRSNGGERELPDLAVALRGQIPLQLLGFVDSVGKKGSEVRRVRSRFLNLPDAPVSRFELKLSGGKKGLLENSKNLCQLSDNAKFQLTGQNGATHDTEPKVQVKCEKGKGGGKKGGKKSGGGKKK